MRKIDPTKTYRKMRDLTSDEIEQIEHELTQEPYQFTADRHGIKYTTVRTIARNLQRRTGLSWWMMAAPTDELLKLVAIEHT